MSSFINEHAESRRRFINSIGGASAVARRHGASSRQAVHNQIHDGFYHSWKPILLQDAERLGVAPHPELLKPRIKKGRWFATDISIFIRDLSYKYDSFKAMSNATDIPLSSLRFMCEKSGDILFKHVPKLEEVANEKGVELPVWWPSIRAKYARWKLSGMDKRDSHLCRKKKILNMESGKGFTKGENLDKL